MALHRLAPRCDISAMGKLDDALAGVIRQRLAVEIRLADLEAGDHHFTKGDGGDFLDIIQELIQEYRARLAELDKLIAQMKGLNS
jgi:hypothetical protein